MSAVRWLSPSPLWEDLLASPAGFRAPTLLRFAGDDFVDQYQGALATRPRNLRKFVAKPETWREPAAGLDAPVKPGSVLRLYQPVHGRFYMVSASLACRVPGLPEHTVDVAKGEVVAFVLRRITTTDAGAETGEWAWVKRADGAEGWMRATGAALAADEELIPMFASTYAGTGGLGLKPMQRRVFAGLVPASKREAYATAREVAAQTPVPGPGSLEDPRTIEFQRAVLDPWVELKEWYDTQKPDDLRRPDALESAEASSAFILLDFYLYLERELPLVAEAIRGKRVPTTLAPQQKALYDALNAVGVTTAAVTSRATLVQAIDHAADKQTELEALAGTTTRTPAGYIARVLVGDPRDLSPAPVPGQPAADEAALVALLLARESSPLEINDPPDAVFGPRRLKKLVMNALAEAGPADVVVPEQLPAGPPANVAGDDWFTVRCVYLRPYCGKKSPPVVSERSERFRLVSFFEPDAPARHLRVALPVDTSPATLRKYNRNVAFMLGDQLRKQMSRATDLKKLMDGEAGSEAGGITFGVICSLSIPIITICAFIILMILVSLLNIIFWWLPLFKICFPVPKAK